MSFHWRYSLPSAYVSVKTGGSGISVPPGCCCPRPGSSTCHSPCTQHSASQSHHRSRFQAATYISKAKAPAKTTPSMVKFLRKRALVAGVSFDCGRQWLLGRGLACRLRWPVDAPSVVNLIAACHSRNVLQTHHCDSVLGSRLKGRVPGLTSCVGCGLASCSWMFALRASEQKRTTD